MEDLLTFYVAAFVVLALAWGWELAKHAPAPKSWEDFIRDLEAERKWFACVEGPGCDWPEHCRPGDCRRPS